MRNRFLTLVVLCFTIPGQGGFATLPQYPGEIKDFKKEEFKRDETLSEALKKREQEVQRCFQKGKGNTSGIEKVDQDKNADRETVNKETTKTILNCEEGYRQIQVKLLESIDFGADRYSVQRWYTDERQKHERLKILNETQARNIQKKNEERKDRGFIEHQNTTRQKQRKDIERRLWNEVNTEASILKFNITTLLQRTEEVSSQELQKK